MRAEASLSFGEVSRLMRSVLVDLDRVIPDGCVSINVCTVQGRERVRTIRGLEDATLFDFGLSEASAEFVRVVDPETPRAAPWMSAAVIAPGGLPYWSLNWGVWHAQGAEPWFASYMDRVISLLPTLDLHLAAGLSRHEADEGLPAYTAGRLPELLLNPLRVVPGFYWLNVLSAGLVRTLPPMEEWPSPRDVVLLDTGAVVLRLADVPTSMSARTVERWMTLLPDSVPEEVRRLTGEWWIE